MLASVSSASSSIHSTTERQTSPTTLCRWPGLQRHAGSRPLCGADAGLQPAAEGLGPVGRHARRRMATELHAHRARGGREQDALVGLLPEPGIAAPAVDRLLEIADHRKAEGRQSRRHQIDPAEDLLRHLKQPLVGGRVERALAIGPVAAGELGHAIEHRARRPEPERRAHDEPEEHAEDMPVRGQQRMLHHVAQDFGARQLAGIEMQPFGQQAAHLVLVATVERVAHVGEVVAELAKAQREVQHCHVEGHGQQQAVVTDAKVEQRDEKCRHQHRHPPHDPHMARLAGIEVAAGPAHPGHQPVMHPVVARQRLELFDQQREQDGEETHRRR